MLLLVSSLKIKELILFHIHLLPTSVFLLQAEMKVDSAKFT